MIRYDFRGRSELVAHLDSLLFTEPSQLPALFSFLSRVDECRTDSIPKTAPLARRNPLCQHLLRQVTLGV
jgi:hypothetical protein